MGLGERLEALGRQLGQREAAFVEELQLARARAEELRADVAEALDSDVTPFQAIAPVLDRCARLDAVVYAIRGNRRGVTRAPVAADHVFGLHADVFHVVRRRAHVFRGDVAAVQRVDRSAVRTEDHLTVRLAVVPPDDGLAAAEIEAGDRCLVGHPARESERVDDRLTIVPVVPVAGAAKRRPHRGVVDRDDASISEVRIIPEHELLVPPFGHQFK